MIHTKSFITISEIIATSNLTIEETDEAVNAICHDYSYGDKSHALISIQDFFSTLRSHNVSESCISKIHPNIEKYLEIFNHVKKSNNDILYIDLEN